MAVGSFFLSLIPASFGIAGYITPIVVITAIMPDILPDERGVMSGMLSLSRNLGLITGSSVM